MTKTWKGFYRFESEEEKQTPKVDFTAQLKFNGDEFEGSCKESGTSAHREAALMKGFIDRENNTISFILKYPYSYWEGEDGTVEYDTSQPHPDIYYFGNFNSETNSYDGEWEMTTEVYDEDGEPFEWTCYGTWEMFT